MIAFWMVYALVTGALIALTAWLLERVGGALRLPTRGIWIAAMATMLALGVVAAAPSSVKAWRGHSTSAGARVAGGEPTDHTTPTTRLTITEAAAPRAWPIYALDRHAGILIGRLVQFDRPLLMLWAVVAAFLLGIVVHAAFEGRRLRYGLESRDVLGTSVLLSDGIGPSAAGVRHQFIVLPRWMLELETHLLSLVVRHEREHVAAHDPMLLLAALLLVVVVPWHIPLWWSWRRLRLAIEVDCDQRVLRAHTDVRSYAQLLLLTGQRITALPWVSRPVVTVVAPLRPQATQLERRITAMTEPRARRPWIRFAPLVAAGSLVFGVTLVLPTPSRAAAAQGAIVKVTSLGMTMVDTLPIDIRIYAVGTARVGIGIDPPTLVRDTIRLDRLPAFTADVTDGDVHVVLVSAGSMKIGATGVDGAKFEASGRRIVLYKGGRSISGTSR